MGITKEQFRKLDVLEQGRVKWKFLQAHFSAFVRIQASNVLEHLAEVLHRNDMEQIERDMQNKSNNIVMQNLLMRLSRTCKPWWIPLEKYLLEEGDNKLYSFLNPWRDFEEHGATAASPESFFRNSDRSSEGFQRPYSCDTPLGKTSGLVDVLRSCPWRKLADVLGFNMDEQRAVKYSASYDNDFHQHLIDAYIEKYRSNATVGSMVRALLQLKTEGRRIVSFMEEAQLIVNNEREGSEAGEARGEESHGFNVTESASGASAGTRQTSLFLNCSPHSPSTTATNNFSAHEPINGSSANDYFPSSAFHPTDRIVSRTNQESVSSWHMQEDLHRLVPSPGTTQPSQVNQEMEIPIGNSSCQNSEPGNFRDYEHHLIF
ncbi:uncharacterized protein LOC112564703 [Pomacea canaliculata]|uniref:uncharacterized protein LOC112564703 n=1 Tax=Pomacea canaliculata TaxID=400727 RepID=UPI000D734BE2|nr:uncharacterized protein LOC112564703 [Pomacea canaliculata]